MASQEHLWSRSTGAISWNGSQRSSPATKKNPSARPVVRRAATGFRCCRYLDESAAPGLHTSDRGRPRLRAGAWAPGRRNGSRQFPDSPTSFGRPRRIEEVDSGANGTAVGGLEVPKVNTRLIAERGQFAQGLKTHVAVAPAPSVRASSSGSRPSGSICTVMRRVFTLSSVSMASLRSPRNRPH